MNTNPDSRDIRNREVDHGLLRLIAQRYESHISRDLKDYLESNYLFRESDPEFAQYLWEHRVAVLDNLRYETTRAAIIATVVEKTTGFTWSRNQFVPVSAEAFRILRAIYDTMLRESQDVLSSAASLRAMEEGVMHVLNNHHDRLRLFFAALCAETAGASSPTEVLLRSVPCEQYSPEAQLSILALDEHDLLEPILDIGCGSNGSLVQWLRARGLDATGVDRTVPSVPGFLNADWHDAPLDPGTWGTVVAHQSLSLHFLFHHNNGTTVSTRLASLYMRILASLKTGGRFCYAPSIPEFESVLAQRPDVTLRYIDINPLHDNSALGSVARAVHVFSAQSADALS